jgi:DNA-binding CsgD family transcriptional regulator
VLTRKGIGVESATDFPDAATIGRLLPELARNIDSHPFVNYHLRPERESILRVSDALTLPQWKDRAIYQEFYRPLEVPFQTLFHLPDDQGRQAAISLFRSHSDFSDRDKAMLEFLRPHFTVAWNNAKMFERLQQKASCLEGTVRAGSVELLWLDRDLRMLEPSDRVTVWLGRYGEPSVAAPGALPEPILSWVRRRLEDLATLGNGRGVSAQLELRREQSCLRLRLRLREEGGVLLLLTETGGPEVVRRLIELGISPREIDVCRWIVEGKTNSEIGLLLGISARTVEKHVERILQKLGVEHRQGVAQVLSDLGLG